MNFRCSIVAICLVTFCAAPVNAQRSKTGAKAYEQIRNLFNAASDGGTAARRQSTEIVPRTPPNPNTVAGTQASWKPDALRPIQVNLDTLRRPAQSPPPSPTVKVGSGQASVVDTGRESVGALNDLKRVDTSNLSARFRHELGASIRKTEDQLAASTAAARRANADAKALNKQRKETDSANELKNQEKKSIESKRFEQKKSREKKTAESNRQQEVLRQEITAFSQSGAEIKKSQLSRAGHALTKHAASQRGGSSKFPQLEGNALQINKIAQDQLDDILTGPNTVRSAVARGNFRGGTRFTSQNGRSATFDKQGVFQYFGE